MSEELRAAQGRNSSLQASLDKSQQDSNTLSGQRMELILHKRKCRNSCECCVFILSFVLAECQRYIGTLEAEVSKHFAQVEALTAQLKDTQAEKSQLVEQVASINSLLEASQPKKEEQNQENAAELDRLKLR